MFCVKHVNSDIIAEMLTCSFCMCVNRNLEDFVTWVDTSAIRRHVMEYNEMVCTSLTYITLFIVFKLQSSSVMLT
jgi:hypothetical protein